MAAVTAPRQAAAAELRVAPVVSTSSTSTAPPGGRDTDRNRRPPRRLDRIWLRWSMGARSTSATGRPAVRARATASALPGSVPNLARRGSDLGTGTRAVAPVGRRSTRRGASPEATRSAPRYFMAWTALRIGPPCSSSERTSTPDGSLTSPPGRRDAAQAGHTDDLLSGSLREVPADGFHHPHTTHTMPPVVSGPCDSLPPRRPTMDVRRSRSPSAPCPRVRPTTRSRVLRR